MASKKQQTHAKRARELAVKEKRERKRAKKAERALAAEGGFINVDENGVPINVDENGVPINVDENGVPIDMPEDESTAGMAPVEAS